MPSEHTGAGVEDTGIMVSVQVASALEERGASTG